MAEARKMPFFHMGHDMMEDDKPADKGAGADEGHDDGKGQGGDGMHHHELHQDEGGGYHSKHTGPDGQVTEGDHATYDDAKSDMDAACGEGGGDPEDGIDAGVMGDDDGSEMSAEDDGNDVAGHYGRAAGR